MKKTTKAILGTVTGALAALTMCASVIPAQAETQGAYGNTSLRPTSSITYSGTTWFDYSGFKPDILKLDSVTVYNTDVTVTHGNNLWPAYTVDYVDGEPDTSTMFTWQYTLNDAGQPIQVVLSNGNIVNYSYDDAGRLISESEYQAVYDKWETNTYAYNADGSLADSEDGSKVANYDEEGRFIGYTYYSDSDSSSYSILSTYDENGRICKKTHTTPIGSIMYYYYYDTLGYLREMASYNYLTGYEEMQVYDYGDANSQLGDFTLQYPVETTTPARNVDILRQMIGQQ